MQADWLRRMAGVIEKGGKPHPCPKALRRAADNLDRLAALEGHRAHLAAEHARLTATPAEVLQLALDAAVRGDS